MSEQVAYAARYRNIHFERRGGVLLMRLHTDNGPLKWGALEGSEEASTCKRHAPAAQRQKMASEYRLWFSERRRPPRG